MVEPVFRAGRELPADVVVVYYALRAVAAATNAAYEREHARICAQHPAVPYFARTPETERREMWIQAAAKADRARWDYAEAVGIDCGPCAECGIWTDQTNLWGLPLCSDACATQRREHDM